MKIKLRLRNPNGIACDPESRITWTGKNIVKSDITTFVASAIARGLLERIDIDDDSLIKLLRAINNRFPDNDWCDNIAKIKKPCGKCKGCKIKQNINSIIAGQDKDF
jgi:hypothetical protein